MDTWKSVLTVVKSLKWGIQFHCQLNEASFTWSTFLVQTNVFKKSNYMILVSNYLKNEMNQVPRRHTLSAT